MFYKPRIPLLYIFLSLTLLALGCSSSPSSVTESEEDNEKNNNKGDGTEEVIEPTFSIDNPADGEELSGELVFSIDGEAEEGFSELRILLGEEEIASASNPAMPYEETLNTFEFDNGDYDLTAELDVAGEDSTISETVTVHFKNYLFSINADGLVRSDIENSSDFNLYISDPEGTILESTDLSGATGMVGLVPPEALEGEAPEYFNVTIATKYEQSNNSAATFVGFEPWVTSWDAPRTESASSSMEYDTDLRVEISNPSFRPVYWGAVSNNTDSYSYFQPQDDTYPVNLTVNSESNNLLSYIAPDPESEDNIPRYYWEKDLQSLELASGDTVRYDAATDFQKMKVHEIAHSSDLQLYFYNLYMSADPDTWSSGSLWIPLISDPNVVDQNASSSVYGMTIPESDHLIDLTMLMQSPSNPNVLHQQVTGSLPDEFETVDADVNQTAVQNFSDITFDFSGSFDYGRLHAFSPGPGEQNGWTWSIYMADSQESFTPPKITEEFNWEEFTVQGVEFTLAGGIDGFDEYIDYLMTDSNLTITSYHTKAVTFDSQAEGPAKRKGIGFDRIKQPEQSNQPAPLLLHERRRPVKIIGEM